MRSRPARPPTSDADMVDTGVTFVAALEKLALFGGLPTVNGRTAGERRRT